MAYQGKKSWARKLDYGSVVAAALTFLLLKQKDSTSLLSMQPPPDGPRAHAVWVAPRVEFRWHGGHWR